MKGGIGDTQTNIHPALNSGGTSQKPTVKSKSKSKRKKTKQTTPPSNQPKQKRKDDHDNDKQEGSLPRMVEKD